MYTLIYQAGWTWAPNKFFASKGSAEAFARLTLKEGNSPYKNLKIKVVKIESEWKRK